MATIKPERQDDWEPLESIEGTLEEEHKLKEDREEVDYFVDGQFIVTGLQHDIEAVVGGVFGALDPINRVVMKKQEGSSEQSQDSRSESPPPRPDTPTLFPPERLEDLEIHLYEIPDGDRPVGEAIVDIYRAAIQMKGENTIELGVYADPNYLAGRHPRIKLSADPDCVEAGPAAPPQGAIGDFMESQWALGQEGIKLFDDAEPNPNRCCKDLSGHGVCVGIFDTSPFDDQGRWAIDWVEPNLELYVHHPGEVVPVKSHGSAPDIRDHGLFVAGLVHVVAPESEIHLIRVLNEKNQGDLDTLVNALKLFTNRTMGTRGTLRGTVINLSLGVHPPPDMRAAGLADLEDLISEVSRLNTERYTRLTEDWVTIASLQTTLQDAYRDGAVIVAAAGNDSRKPPEVQPAQIPAAYPFVIGVAGSNFCGDRACFSNAGDVAAPSGDVGRAGKKTVANCNRWPGFCITSLAIHARRRGKRPTGFAHWIGTSFATPLVSGQAALLLEDMGMSPDGVRMAIEGTAVKPTPPDPDLGAGVIDLTESLPAPP